MFVIGLMMAAAIDMADPVGRNDAVQIIQDAARDEFKDPESTRFEWPNGFVNGWYKPMFRQKYTGWITCGTVNSKNGYGGYTGKAAIIGVLDDTGAIVKIDVDDASSLRDPSYGPVAQACGKIGVPVF